MSASQPRAAVVLAAGRGDRLGGRPKSLLELDGVPLIRRLVDALRACGVDDVIVVTGHHAEPVRQAVQGLPLRTVHNRHPEADPASSQRLGLAAVAHPDGGVLMALADQPLIEAAALRAMFAAWHQRPAGADALHPLVDGLRGNPVLLGVAARAEILAGPPGFGGRAWQAAHPDRVHAWRTADAAYRVDIDTPADLAAFEHRTGRALHWPAALRR